MSVFFEKEPTIHVYGDGDGHIIFEEWIDDQCTEILNTVKISRQRFEDLMHHHFDDLCAEAFDNPNIPKEEKND